MSEKTKVARRNFQVQTSRFLDVYFELEYTVEDQERRIARLEKALADIAMTCNAELFDVSEFTREQLTDDARVLFDLEKIADEALSKTKGE